MQKKIERTFFSSVSTQKRWETAGSGATLPQYLPNPKNKFPVKFIFTYSVFVLLSTGKKTKTISLKVFMIIAFENWQKETKKGTLRSFNFKNLMLCLVIEGAPSSKKKQQNKYIFYFILTSFLKACVHYFLINFYFFTL